MCSNAQAPRSEAWGRTLAASRVPPDSGREGRENVAARAPEEQHDEDCARQDDLRERQIWVDVDNRRKLDPNVTESDASGVNARPASSTSRIMTVCSPSTRSEKGI